VKVVGNSVNAFDGDILWQHSIEFVGYMLTINLFESVEVRHIERCVDACVGAPCAYYLGRSSQQLTQGILQSALYGWLLWLSLPTAIGFAIVL
jgi:hypothetical protein